MPVVLYLHTAWMLHYEHHHRAICHMLHTRRFRKCLTYCVNAIDRFACDKNK